MTTGTHKVAIKFWQNIDQEFFKVEYLMKISKYFANFAKAVKTSHNKTFFSKIFADFIKVFNFEKFLFMLCQNLIEILYVPVVIYIS